MPLPKLKKGSPEAYAWAAKMQKIRERVRAAGKKAETALKVRAAGSRMEKKFFGKGGALEIKNPDAAWHSDAAKAAEKRVRSAISSLEKVLYKGMQVAHEDSARAAKVYKTKDRVKKNPIAIYNPPEVAGVIYKNAIEIRAEKMGGKLKGFYKHAFGPNVQILGLTNGDVLLHHKHGKRLWISREDYERTGRRHS